MTGTFQTLLFFVGVLVVVAVVARRLSIAPSILLVIAGIAIALVPGLPAVELAPEFVLLAILPPLIYSAGVSMSWREFRFNLRPISLLAVGCVVFTTCAVAAAAHYILGFSWGVGFVLGAIVSPPDVIAPLAITRRLTLPHRLMVVLEGEGLANDATALILYRFAVAAVATGSFSFGEAVGNFAVIVVGELIFGIGVGWLSLRLRRWAADPRVEITLSLMTPYVAYWIPEHLGGSGVLATVAAGLYVSWNGPLLIPASTRLQGIFFWDLIIYLVEGFVFLLTGLEARALLANVQSFTMRELIVGVAVTTVIAVVARFVWVFPAIYVPRWVSPSLARRDPAPSWRQSFALSVVGVRGVVSLAAALAIPLTLANGEPFPHRDFILFIAFGVIIITLVGIGLVLPTIIKALGVAKDGAVEKQRELAGELNARLEALQSGQRRLEELAADGDLPTEVFGVLRNHYDGRMLLLPRSVDDTFQAIVTGTALRLKLIASEREELHRLLREGKVSDASRRRIERELDLEEETIRTAMEREGHRPL